MGKIFDALEKADKRIEEVNRKILDSKKRKKGKSEFKRKSQERKKVVPLVNSQSNAKANQIDKTLIAYHSPQSVEAELFKVLRTNLLFPDSGTPPRTILVTSALPGDGKSFISSNLAISIAQGVEEHVLLIDGDIRKPAIHSRFGFQQQMGLSDYLSGGDDIGTVLLKTLVPKLTILPSGVPPENPTDLMSSKKMRALLEEVKSRYNDRYIIVDSPPPAMASETNAMAKHVDGIIVVVRAGKTPKDAVADTIEQLGRDKILGIVLNYADQSSKKYYGYGKTYYKD